MHILFIPERKYLMSNSALTVSDIANLPEQKTAALWTRAYDILSNCPRKLLETREDSGNIYKLTPVVEMKLSQSDKPHLYSIAARVSSKFGGIRSTDQLFLVIDNNVANLQVTFGKYTMDTPLTRPESNTEVSTDGISGLLDTIDSEVQDAKRKAKQALDDDISSVKSAMPIILSILVVVVMIVLVVLGIRAFVAHNNSVNERNAQHARELLVNYDKKAVVLSSLRLVPGKSMVIETDSTALADEVPPYDQINDQPREQSIAAGQCINVGQLPEGRSVAATTDGPSDEVTGSVNKSGRISLCALPNQYTYNSASYRVLLQMRPLSEAMQ